LGGRQAEIGRQLVATASHRIVMRHMPGIGPKHRIKFGSRIFNVGHVRNVEELDNVLEITATEELN
jgi:head-tail adaptor